MEFESILSDSYISFLFSEKIKKLTNLSIASTIYLRRLFERKRSEKWIATFKFRTVTSLIL